MDKGKHRLCLSEICCGVQHTAKNGIQGAFNYSYVEK